MGMLRRGPEEAAARTGAWRFASAAGALALLVGAVYVPVLAHEFINYDDNRYVVENPHVRGGLTWESVRWAFAATHAANWHPLAWISHMADVSLFGMNPRGHHAVNVMIHAINAVLLAWTLGRMTGALWPSVAVAALFGAHPLHVESVAWVAERKDLLCGLFWMLAMAAYHRYALAPSIRRYLGVALCCALALLSKPMAVTLPIALLLLDMWPLGRSRNGSTSWKWLVVEKVPLGALSAASAIVTLAAQHAGGAVRDLEAYPFSVRVANAMMSYGHYAVDLFWPARLAVFYPHPNGYPPPLHLLGAAAMIAVMLGAAVALRRKMPCVTVGILWFFITLLPVIGLVQVGSMARADRYTYLPAIGLFIAAAWAVAATTRSRPMAQKFAAMMAIALVVVYAVRAHAAVRSWRDSETLFRHAIAVTGPNPVACTNLGHALLVKNDLDGAQEQFETALRLKPGHVRAIINQGIVSGMRGDLATAVQRLEQAVALAPGNPDAHVNLANALAMSGQFDKAAEHYAATLRLNPDDDEARRRLALITSLGDGS
ncbi:MAG TPA: tetratricopeptide repeat protein [Candidatus Hydrogenedentes bacterium]|nr:tetratricopeptide repeat protein [Candidatus Hydrogenedentota bacterium]HOS02475.1 tetratricopeptide repeat protein [Candidatus Hydrogenedentota bacterium]